MVDNFGIAVMVTAEVLGVVIHLVGTSNDDKNPVTTIGEVTEEKKVFHIGYYQDTSDVQSPGTHAYKVGSLPKFGSNRRKDSKLLQDLLLFCFHFFSQ